MNKKKSISIYILIGLVVVQGLSAIPSAIILLLDTSGTMLGVGPGILESSPFSTYTIPALFLLVVLGLFPVVIAFGLIKEPAIRFAERLNIYHDYHWSWTCSFYLGLIMIMWINIQLYFIKSYSILHVVVSMMGVAIIIFSHMPATKVYYKRNLHSHELVTPYT